MRSKPVTLAFQWSLVAFAGVALMLVARHWTFVRLGLVDFFLLPCLAAMCVWPGIRWYRRGMEWLPLGELFAACHLLYYVLPCLSDQQESLSYSPSVQTTALIATGIFLGSFLAVYCFIVWKPRDWSLQSAIWLRRPVVPGAMWGMLVFWLAWNVLLPTGLLPSFGTAYNIFLSAASAAGSFAAVYLLFQVGQRTISKVQSRLAVGGLALGLALTFASGYLNGAVQSLLSALLGFTLGRKRAPVMTLIFCTSILVILQLGKTEYRAIYWSNKQAAIDPNGSVLQRYSVWLGAGWKNLWSHEGHGEAKSADVTARANQLTVLSRAIKMVPDEKPFLTGQTSSCRRSRARWSLAAPPETPSPSGAR